MGYPLFSVSVDGTDYSDSVVITAKRGLKTKVSTSEFQVQNLNDDYRMVDTFSIDDPVEIYLGHHATGSVVAFSGFINELTQVSDKNQRTIKVEAVNKLERLLSSLDAKDYPPGGEDTTASEIIKDIIERLNSQRPNETPITTNNVTSTTLNITPFAFNYKPIIEILRDLATKDYTDGKQQYIYFIDNDNDLHFKPRPDIDTIPPELHEYQFTDFRATKGVFDTVNAVIVNCGTDGNGDAVLALGVNYSSVTAVGFRWKYVERKETADSITTEGLSVQEEREAIRKEGENWARGYVKLLGEVRFKITASMKGNYNYPGTSTQMVIGESVRVTSPSNWTGSLVLRLIDIKQTYTSRGWTTELILEEDDKTKLET